MDALEALRTEFAKDDEVDYVGLAFRLETVHGRPLNSS